MHRILAEHDVLYSSGIKYLYDPRSAPARLSISSREKAVCVARLLDARAPFEASGVDLIVPDLIFLAARAAFVLLRAHHVTCSPRLLVYANALHHSAAHRATVNASLFTALLPVLCSFWIHARCTRMKPGETKKLASDVASLELK